MIFPQVGDQFRVAESANAMGARTQLLPERGSIDNRPIADDDHGAIFIAAGAVGGGASGRVPASQGQTDPWGLEDALGVGPAMREGLSHAPEGHPRDRTCPSQI
jgi:hypothetical protein